LRHLKVGLLAGLALLAISVASLVGCGRAFADGQSGGLSLRDAVARALECSPTVRVAAAEVERARAVRDDAAQSMRGVQIPTGLNQPPGVVTGFYNLVTSDLNWQMAKRSLSLAEEQVVLETVRRYWAVVDARAKLAAAEAALEQARISKQAAWARVVVGAATEKDYSAARASLSNAEAAVEQARQALDQAYEALNEIAGLGWGARPELTDSPAFEAAAISDVDAEVARALSVRPELVNALNAVDLARIQWQLPTQTGVSGVGAGLSQPWEARQKQLRKAEEQVEATRQQIRETVRDLCIQLQQLEEQYPALQAALASAEKQFRVVSAYYHVGMATREELVGARAGYEKARRAIVSLTCQHASLAARWRAMTGREVLP
jgi:outer membrane protein TolC